MIRTFPAELKNRLKALPTADLFLWCLTLSSHFPLLSSIYTNPLFFFPFPQDRVPHDGAWGAQADGPIVLATLCRPFQWEHWPRGGRGQPNTSQGAASPIGELSRAAAWRLLKRMGALQRLPSSPLTKIESFRGKKKPTNHN